MRSRTNPQLVFLAIDDDGRDLLVHEDEDGGEECRGYASKDGIPGVVAGEPVYEPTPVRAGGLGKKNPAEFSVG